jgi:hypothetical protein
MDEFNVTAKLWPSGADLDLGTDSNLVTVPSSFNRHAANWVTSMDGSHNYQFLFWNTGRHMTNKRHVRWNFSVGGWGVWNATAWYGTPPHNGHGPQRVHVDPFTIGGNAPLTGTAIDGTASTYAGGAYPLAGNDREIGTAGGAVNAVAKDPFSFLAFAGWLQLIWGGDDGGEFVETDTGASPGSPGFYATASGPFHVNQGGSADLLATYGNSAGGLTIDWGAILAGLGVPLKPGIVIGPGDPGPDDRIRLAFLEELIAKAGPERGGDPAADFRQIITAVPKMSMDELKRSRQTLLTTLELGKSALSTIDAKIKQGGG